jgi:DNA segregation ATPase FtsK/SpoIIIE and related proteins
LGLAITSFFVSFFSGAHQEFGLAIFNRNLQIDNVTGKIGAFFAQLLVKESFGIGAFYFVFLFSIIGIRLTLNVKVKMWTIWKYALMSLAWLPLFFAFLPVKQCAIFGGTAGQWLNNNLYNYIGNAGIVITLVFTFLIYAIYQFNITFAFIDKMKEKRAAKKAREEAIRAIKQQKAQQQESKQQEPINDNSRNSNIPSNNVVEEQQHSPEGARRNAIKDGYLDNRNTNNGADDDGEENHPTITVIRREPQADAAHSQPKPIVQQQNTHEIDLQAKPVYSQPLEKHEEKIEETPVERAATPIVTTTTDSSKVELVVEETPKEETVDEGKVHHGLDTEFDPRFELNDFKFPGLDLLRDFGEQKADVSGEELEANKNRIVETLSNYGISIDKIKATIGPTVTLYEIVPAPGIRISKIKNLEDDIALSLSALGIRIIAPIPGKGTIGIEVPNSKPETVSMKSVLSSEKFQKSKYALPFAIGKTISNETYVADLAKMPHILMAGATGQGKSVGLNAIIASLLYFKHPSELKFVMVDPKKVELTLYNRIERHYLAKLPDSDEAIITDVKKVIRTLNSLCIEMDNRYELLKAAQCRNIIEYNEKFKARRLLPTEGHRFLPYIVLIVDEFADLIMTAGREVESPIARLAQLARAIGIHLIIATQRPSVNIITGSIKANFPARIAFRVISAIDSKTILDQSGANQLIGRGDMLLSTGNDLVRLQCAFIDTPEVEAITDFIGAQRGYPEAFLLPEVPAENDEHCESEDANPGERDSLFEEAAHIVVQTQQGSTSMIQRKLKLGYNRAGRIIDQLEAAGIVGPFAGSKTREVKVANEFALEQILKDLDNHNLE